MANNLRATGFAIGTWISLCGMTCVIFDLNTRIETISAVVITYIVVLGGALLVAMFAWKVNDRKARQFAVPTQSWDALLGLSHSNYVRNVAADAVLLFAEKTSGMEDIDMLLPSISACIKAEHVKDTYNSRFIETRLAAAYLLFACGQRTYDKDAISTKRDDSHDGIMSFSDKKSLSLSPFLAFFIRCASGGRRRLAKISKKSLLFLVEICSAAKREKRFATGLRKEGSCVSKWERFPRDNFRLFQPCCKLHDRSEY